MTTKTTLERTGIFRRRIEKLRERKTSPGDKDRACVARTHTQLREAVENAENTSRYLPLWRSENIAKKKMVSMKKMDMWFDKWTKDDHRKSAPAHWKCKLRLARTISEALDTGSLVLADLDDVEIFTMVLYSYFQHLPQICEYYISTGEILNLLELFREGDDGIDPVSLSAENVVRAYRLYCYDVAMVKEHLDAGTNPDDHFDALLDARMVFAGFWEPVKGRDDFRWDYKGVPLEERMGSETFWSDVVYQKQSVADAINHHYILPGDVLRNRAGNESMAT